MGQQGYPVVLEDVSFHVSNRTPVLCGVNLRIEPGEVVALLGLNGAGKSSLLRAIAGELPGVSGRVVVGKQIVNKPINQVIDGVGVVHQWEEEDLIDQLTIGQNIAIRQILGGGSGGGRIFAATARWQRAMRETVGAEANLPVDEFDLDSAVTVLSGGEKQMLSVAIAVHLEHEHNPCRLLLLDEHTSRLDHRYVARVMEYTREQVTKCGATVVMVTHRYNDVVGFASRVVVLSDGKVTTDRKVDSGDSVGSLTKLVEQA